MSSQKVTLADIIEKWSELTTQDSQSRWDEMNAFFEEAAEAGVTSQEILRCKNQIVRVWVPVTWQEAQKTHESWKNKDWWNHKKKATLKTFDKWYGEYYLKSQKEARPEKRAEETPRLSQRPTLKVVGESFVDDDGFEIWTDSSQAIEHRRKMDEKEKGGRR